jgi:hypothetical protein
MFDEAERAQDLVPATIGFDRCRTGLAVIAATAAIAPLSCVPRKIWTEDQPAAVRGELEAACRHRLDARGPGVFGTWWPGSSLS